MKMKFLKELLFLFVLFSTSIIVGQTVTGTVTGDGLPLPGVNVQVKNTIKGTTTDFDGKYTISDIGNDAVLIFNSIGFFTKEIVVAGKAKIDVALEEDIQSLETVVVTGYSSQSTKDITGAVSVVKAKDLQAVSPTNVEQALQGQAAGVTVGSQGGPGGEAAVRIRGFGSTNGNDPLYVIDGTPTTAGLNDINPNDIESIQVLKDASAAIYGFRGANGVVIITTKRGNKSGKVKLQANVFSSVDFIPESVFPDLASPQQILDARLAAGQTATGITNIAQNGQIPEFLRGPGPGQTLADYSLEDGDRRFTRANIAGTDWFDEYFDKAISKNYNLNVSGGGENSEFFISLSGLNQEGVAAFTAFDRYTIRANSSFDVTDKLRIGENISYTYSDQILPQDNTDEDNNAIAALYRIHPLIPVFDEGGNFAGANVGNLGNGKNPLALASRNRNNDIIRNRIIGNVFAEYDLIKNLTLKTNFSINVATSNTTNFTPTSFEGETPAETATLTESNDLDVTYNWFNTIQYKKDITEKFNLDLLAGTEFNDFNSRFFNATGVGFDDESVNLRTLNNLNDPTGSTVDGDNFTNRFWSIFGQANLKFDDKYLLSGIIRRDANSRFNKDSRVGYFPSVSAGWRISNEAFLENSDIFSNLLLKASWGLVGNDGNIPVSSRATTLSPGTGFNFPTSTSSSAQGFGVTNNGNPDLEWETTRQANIGLSSSFANGFKFDIDVYQNVTEDNLISVALDPSIFGENNSITRNTGEITNTGFDTSIGYSNINSDGDFKYNVALNVSSYKNEVDFIEEGNPGAFLSGDIIGDNPVTRTQQGEPISSFFGRVVTGQDANGNFTFRGDGEDGEQREFIGSPHPDFTYGLNFSATYKNFDFSMFWQGSQGNDIYNFLKFYTDTNAFIGARSVDFINANGVPGPAANGNDQQPSDFFVEDGSYTRLKNILIGYTLPESLTNKLKLSKIRIYVQGKNLLTFTDYSGLDPEVNLRNFNDDTANLTFGVDTGSYPVNRSVIFGLNVSL